jgi:hypothetical protein
MTTSEEIAAHKVAVAEFEKLDWVKRYVKLSDKWGITPNEPVLLEGPLGIIENLFHESAHAHALNIPLGPNLSSRVSEALDYLPGDIQVSHEAHTWCIESWMFRARNLMPDHPDDPGGTVGWADISNLAGDQGVEWRHIELLLEIGDHWRMATLLLRELDELAGVKSDGSRMVVLKTDTSVTLRRGDDR